MDDAGLPRIDEHAIDIEASADDAWPALLAVVDRAFAGRAATAYARVAGCTPWRAAGARPLAEGSTVTGFRVARAVEGSELALLGAHRFADYALTFHIDRTGPNRSRLRAESHSAFPGLAGAVYRTLVVRTGAHRHAVRRLVRQVRRRAETA